MGVLHKFNGRAGDFSWEDVPLQRYPNDAARDVTKRVLVGENEGACHFAIRYFEVAPGGHTSLDNHRHDHGVVVVRGKGTLLLGDQKHAIGYGDAIYIEPNEIHQFRNDHPEPLGFLCVVPPRKGENKG